MDQGCPPPKTQARGQRISGVWCVPRSAPLPLCPLPLCLRGPLFRPMSCCARPRLAALFDQEAAPRPAMLCRTPQARAKPKGGQTNAGHEATPRKPGRSHERSQNATHVRVLFHAHHRKHLEHIPCAVAHTQTPTRPTPTRHEQTRPKIRLTRVVVPAKKKEEGLGGGYTLLTYY